MIIAENKELEDVMAECLQAIINQGGKCTDSRKCAYGLRENPNKHCAVGWLLPPERHDLMRSKVGIGGMTEKDLGPNTEFIRENVGPLIDLQVIHDTPSPNNVEKFVELYPSLKELARKWEEVCNDNCR